MNTQMDDKLIVLFDGVCNLCVSSIQFIINRDSKDIFRFTSLQSSEGKKLIKKHSIDIIKSDSIILIQKGEIKYKSTAILFVLSELGFFWNGFIIFYIIPCPITLCCR